MTRTAQQMLEMMVGYEGLGSAYARAQEKEQARGQSRASANRIECLQVFAKALEQHQANLQQALTAYHKQLARLAAIAPDKVQAEAQAELVRATTAGDKQAAEVAARTLLEIKAGTDPAAIERIQLEEQIKQSRADADAAMASLDKAGDAEMRAHFDALEPQIAEAVREYEAVAQRAYDARVHLKGLALTREKMAAALKREDPSASVAFAVLSRPSNEIELPSLEIKGYGKVRPVGRAASGGDSAAARRRRG